MTTTSLPPRQPDVANLIAAIRGGKVSGADLERLTGAIAPWADRLRRVPNMGTAPARAATPGGDEVHESMRRHRTDDYAPPEPVDMRTRRDQRALEALFRQYHDFGPGAVDAAAQFAAEWRQLRARNLVGMPVDRYVAIRMQAWEAQ